MTRQSIQLQKPPVGMFHVYVSPHQPGCTDLVGALREHVQRTNKAQLTSCEEPTLISRCQHYLLYLNADTHNETLPHHGALYCELEAALNGGVHILLVHEQRPDKGGTSFKTIIDATPECLRDELSSVGEFIGKRLCVFCAIQSQPHVANTDQLTATIAVVADKELAVGICGGPHLPASLHLLLGAIAAVPSPAQPGYMTYTYQGGQAASVGVTLAQDWRARTLRRRGSSDKTLLRAVEAGMVSTYSRERPMSARGRKTVRSEAKPLPLLESAALPEPSMATLALRDGGDQRVSRLSSTRDQSQVVHV